MKKVFFSLFAILTFVLLSLSFLPGCKKSNEPATANKSSTLSGLTTKTDTQATPPVKYVTVPLTGDQITLVPHYNKSQTADSCFLILVAETKNQYCYSGPLEFTQSLDNNGNYNISFLDVKEPSTCVSGNSALIAAINFTSVPKGILQNGTFPLTVTLNGTTYTGSIIVTATTISFIWNYNSGVLIVPAQISR